MKLVLIVLVGFVSSAIQSAIPEHKIRVVDKVCILFFSFEINIKNGLAVKNTNKVNKQNYNIS